MMRPSLQRASYNITSFPELAYTMTLQEVVNERVSFLKERINPENRPEINSGFQVQIEVLRSSDFEKEAVLVSEKRQS
jgi:hypothetical protein